MSLQANFEPDPFTSKAGSYYGILTTGFGAQSAGLVRLTVSANGRFTGRIQLAGKAYSFAGRLDGDGAATVTVPVNGGTPLSVTVQADLGDDSGQVTGTVTDGANGFSFSASESAFNVKTNAAPEAGRYTLVLAPNPFTTGSSAPMGAGYATIVVNENGMATVAGRLADGSAFSTTGHVGDDGTLALYFVPSGSPAGSSVDGLLTFQSTDVSDIAGTITWTKGADAAALFYPAGFSTQLPSVGSAYVPPGTGIQPMDISVGEVKASLSDGNLTEALTVPVIVNRADKGAMATSGSPDVTFSINPVSGALTGSFVMPGGNLTRNVRGVVLQKQQSAYGYFRGVNECGSFSLTPGS